MSNRKIIPLAELIKNGVTYSVLSRGRKLSCLRLWSQSGIDMGNRYFPNEDVRS